MPKARARQRKRAADGSTNGVHGGSSIHRLLECPGWELRSFGAIQEHLGGFTDARLRQLLVRSGAIQFWGKKVQPDGRRKELSGLLSKNEGRLPKGNDEARRWRTEKLKYRRAARCR